MADIVEPDDEVGNPDNVTNEEVTEKVTQQEDRIPEKFRGKSVEDIVASYTELEKAYGRKNQEVGELRPIADAWIQDSLNRNKKQPDPVVEESDDDVDFFVDPKKAIERAIENHPKLKQLETKEALNEKQRNFARMQEAHPDFKEIVADDAFREWVGKSKIRQQLYMSADQNFDYDSADELFGTWKELKGRSTAAQTDQDTDKIRQEAEDNLRKASVSTGSSTDAPKKFFRRADLIRLSQTDPDRYEMMSDEILQAYAEKRVK
jgi:hypothetical protein